MTLSDRNKKVLEKVLNCKIEFVGKSLFKIEQYDLQFAHKTLNLYYIDECYVLSDTNFFDIIKSCNELVILGINPYWIYFVFLDDLNNIDI